MSATLSGPLVVTRRLTPDDVRAILGYSQTSTVWKLIHDGGLPAVRFNRRYYINESDLHDWMAERGLVAASEASASSDDAAPVDPDWVAAQVAKFSADDLRRAGELLLALSRADRQDGAA